MRRIAFVAVLLANSVAAADASMPPARVERHAPWVARCAGYLEQARREVVRYDSRFAAIRTTVKGNTIRLLLRTEAGGWRVDAWVAEYPDPASGTDGSWEEDEYEGVLHERRRLGMLEAKLMSVSEYRFAEAGMSLEVDDTLLDSDGELARPVTRRLRRALDRCLAEHG
jgi:hypothetical protein